MTERNENLSEVIDERVAVYGEPTEMFERAAQVWSGITGFPIKATDVPLMFIGYKALRAQVTPEYSDNSDDIEGYLDIFRTVVGDKMIPARSVTEFVDLRRTKQTLPGYTMKEIAAALAIDCPRENCGATVNRWCYTLNDVGQLHPQRLDPGKGYE